MKVINVQWKVFYIIILDYKRVLESSEVCGERSIHSSSKEIFSGSAQNVLTEGQDYLKWSPQATTSWVTKKNQKGNNVYVIIDLNCTKKVNGFYMRYIYMSTLNHLIFLKSLYFIETIILATDGNMVQRKSKLNFLQIHQESYR